MRVRCQNEHSRYGSILYSVLTPYADLHRRGFAATQKGESAWFRHQLEYSIPYHLVGFNLGRGYYLRVELHFHDCWNVLSNGPLRNTRDQALYLFGYGNIHNDHNYVCK